MPLIKSTSKKAFGENIARERAAGKPEKQSVAIAYSEQNEAARHHSGHSAKRSQHYHEVVVGQTDRGATRMTRRVGQKDNLEESDEKL